jgi:hypothetical protein
MAMTGHDLWPEGRRHYLVVFRTAADDLLAISIPVVCGVVAATE